MLTGVAPLQTAEPGDVSFLDNRKYASALAETRAGRGDRASGHGRARARDRRRDRHDRALCRLGQGRGAVPSGSAGAGRACTRRAVVAHDASVDPSAEIGPLAVIGNGAEIGPRCRIGPSAVIGDGVVLGADCRIGAHATISHALLGARVVVYPGARIGQDGFGFGIAADGFVSVPQLGRVVLEDDVEIGANTDDRPRLAA